MVRVLQPGEWLVEDDGETLAGHGWAIYFVHTDGVAHIVADHTGHALRLTSPERAQSVMEAMKGGALIGYIYAGGQTIKAG